MLKRWIPLAIAGSVVGTAALEPAQVGLIRINGAIGPATANYVARAIDAAAEQHDQCLIILLDTPGGLLESTKEIVQTFYASKVPVVVYVSPSGASAGSAGVFITLAADIAAMAPNTIIGAAHPVAFGTGGLSENTNEVMKQKMENYTSSFMESIADKRHRNVEWAKSAVLQNVATTAQKALKANVIDLIADDVPDLLKQLDGRTAGGRTLQTANAKIVDIPMSAGERVFQLIWRPEVMFVLLLIAMYGIVGELSSPGAILPGVVGAIAVILFLFMSATLPVNVAGLALIALAIALFVIDVFAPTHGVLTGGGHRVVFPRRTDAVQPRRAGFRVVSGLDHPGDGYHCGVLHLCGRQGDSRAIQAGSRRDGNDDRQAGDRALADGFSRRPGIHRRRTLECRE